MVSDTKISSRITRNITIFSNEVPENVINENVPITAMCRCIFLNKTGFWQNKDF